MKLSSLLAPSRGRALPERRPKGAVLAATADASLRIGERTIVDGVSIEVAAGELVALVGPNGAGKSTLLALLSGDQAPTSGTIIADGRPLDAWAPLDLARRRAVLPQYATVSFPFTVDEVVRMGRVPWVNTDAEDRDDELVAEALALADVEAFGDRRVPTLSGGERSRVALARVLAQDTQLLMLDEPTAALDIRHQELVLRVARQRVGAGCGVVVVLHDLGLAAAYADRVAVLARGRLVADGPVAEVIDADLLSTVYQHDIDVLHHPAHNSPLVVPRRPQESNGS